MYLGGMLELTNLGLDATFQSQTSSPPTTTTITTSRMPYQDSLRNHISMVSSHFLFSHPIIFSEARLIPLDMHTSQLQEKPWRSLISSETIPANSMSHPHLLIQVKGKDDPPRICLDSLNPLACSSWALTNRSLLLSPTECVRECDTKRQDGSRRRYLYASH